MSRKSKSNAAASVSLAEPPAQARQEDEEMEEEPAERKGVSGFISKIYKMVSDPATQDIVSWNDRGDGFVVRNEFVFASQIMRTYFRHQNFSSFVRQLNFYGFHKRSSPSSLTSFYHPSFRKGRPDLLPQIQRKSTETKDSGLRDLVNNLQNEVAELRQQNEDLFKIQQRMLYVFSKLMRASHVGQVGSSSGNPAVTGSGMAQVEGGSSSAKRIRAGSTRDIPLDSKRQRLLLDSKADSDYHPTYQTKSTQDYFGSSSSRSSLGSSTETPNIVELSTESYAQQQQAQQHGNGYGSHDSNNYSSHALSHFDWSSDPMGTIQSLIDQLGPNERQILNSSTSLPRQIGSSNVSNAASSGQLYRMDSSAFNFGGSNLPLLTRGLSGDRARDGSTNQQAQQLIDFGAQLVGTNPKQLLELLERMGSSDHPSLPSGAADSGRLSMTSGRSGRKGRTADVEPPPQRYGEGPPISGVFEDGDEPTSPVRPKGTKGKRATKTQTSTQQANATPTSSSLSSSASSSSSRSRRSCARSNARLSPLNDEEPAQPFPIKTESLPALSTLPLPTSPISPFMADHNLDNFPTSATPTIAPATAPPIHAHAHASIPSPLPMPASSTSSVGPYSDPAAFSVLPSSNVNIPMPDVHPLSRGVSGLSSASGQGGTAAGNNTDFTSFFPPSPLQHPAAPSSNDHIAPLTPTHLLTSAPPSPSPFRP